MSAVAESLLCDRCGAPLTVGPRARFVTCTHCGARLSVHRSDSAAWTETLEEVAAATGRIEAKLDALMRRSHVEGRDETGDPLDDLERRWRLTRRHLGRRNRNGIYEPDTKKAAAKAANRWIWSGVIAALLCCFVSAVALRGAALSTLCFAGLILIGSVLGALREVAFVKVRARRFVTAERNYARRRAALLGEPAPPEQADR